MNKLVNTIVSIPFEQGDVFRRINGFRYGRISPVSIPFEQGDVFRQLHRHYIEEVLHVSIPFEQGDVFRLFNGLEQAIANCLNPFRAGRCLSTNQKLCNHFA